MTLKKRKRVPRRHDAAEEETRQPIGRVSELEVAVEPEAEEKAVIALEATMAAQEPDAGSGVVEEERYKEMPVSSFGMALLRGMDWRPGDPIGRSNRQAVRLHEVEQRPDLLGLGAAAPALPDINSRKGYKRSR